MRTYDLLMLLVLAVWWVLFRHKYDWKAVALYYLIGVMFADVFCGAMILVAYRHYPNVLTIPALLMPIGGLVGLVYGAAKKKLNKKSSPATEAKQNPSLGQ
jgi:hypothetical protein